MIDFFYLHGFIIELIITTGIFTYFLKKRNKPILRIAITILLLFAISIMWNTFIPTNNFLTILKHTFLFIILIGAILFCFDVSIWEAIFLQTSSFTVQHIAFKLGFFVQSVIIKSSIGNNIAILVYLLIELTIYIFAHQLFALKIKKEHISFKNRNKQIVLMAVALILFTTIFQNLFDIFIEQNNLILLGVVTSYDLVSCILIISIQFAILKNNRLTYETTLVEHIVHQQHERMINSKNNMDLLNIKYHDLRYQVSNLENRIDQEELIELNKVLKGYDLYIDSGNEALNIILSEKKLLCEQNKISLKYMVDGKQLNFMQASDIYSLFGNSIDNAINAVLEVKEEENKYINISIRNIMNMTIIVIDNYYEGDLKFVNNLPVTTKSNTDYHGFGMKSIKYIVDKYKGIMSVKVLNNKFTLSISFENRS